MALTGKKRAFADAVLAGASNKSAAVKAGYSAATASAAGSRLAKDPDVVSCLAKKRAKSPRGRGFTQADGTKAPDAPKDWPFGTVPPAEPAPPKALTAREYLSQVVNDLNLDEKVRLDAAKKLIEFEEAKPAPVGKKEAKEQAAKKAGGRFTPKVPPRLVAAGGKKL